MNAVKAMAKIFTLCLGVASLVAAAETYYDQKFYTANFMDEVAEVELKATVPSDKRIVASALTKKLPEVMKVRNAFALEDAINGRWQITRIIGADDEIIYDSFNREEDSDIFGDFKYNILGNTVRLNGELEQVYKISLMTDQGTIALFKEYGDGYEIVEAKKVKEVERVEFVKKEEFAEKVEKVSKFNVVEDLYIVSALDPKNSKEVLRGAYVSGSAVLKDGLLSLDGIQLHIGKKCQGESFSMPDVNVGPHGTFNDDEGSQGIITTVGKEEIKIRFSTGPLAGVMLNFGTDNKREEEERRFEVPPSEKPEIPGSEEVRKDDNREEENQELSEEDRDEDEEEYDEEEEEAEWANERADYNGELQQGLDRARTEATENYDREPSSTNVKEVGFSF